MSRYEDFKPFLKPIVFLIALVYFLGLITIFINKTISLNNWELIFHLNDDVIKFLNLAVNSSAMMTVPFAIGVMGSLVRISLTRDIRVASASSLKLMGGSGLLAIISFFSWKSGILAELFLEHTAVVSSIDVDDKKLFYKSAVISGFTGMFATSLFLTMENRLQLFLLLKKEQENSSNRND